MKKIVLIFAIIHGSILVAIGQYLENFTDLHISKDVRFKETFSTYFDSKYRKLSFSAYIMTLDTSANTIVIRKENIEKRKKRSVAEYKIYLDSSQHVYQIETWEFERGTENKHLVYIEKDIVFKRDQIISYKAISYYQDIEEEKSYMYQYMTDSLGAISKRLKYQRSNSNFKLIEELQDYYDTANNVFERNARYYNSDIGFAHIKFTYDNQGNWIEQEIINDAGLCKYTRKFYTQ